MEDSARHTFSPLLQVPLTCTYCQKPYWRYAGFDWVYTRRCSGEGAGHTIETMENQIIMSLSNVLHKSQFVQAVGPIGRSVIRSLACHNFFRVKRCFRASLCFSLIHLY
jgi:hypothetical protein